MGGLDWDDVVEVSVVCHTGPLQVWPIDDEDWVNDLPRLDTVGPGPYRVRVHARNRDIAGPDPDGFGSATDEYVIVSWPEPVQPPLLIRLTDLRGFATRASQLPAESVVQGPPVDSRSTPSRLGRTDASPLVRGYPRESNEARKAR